MKTCTSNNAVTLKNAPVRILGNFPKRGEKVPDFTLVGSDLSDVTLVSLGKVRKILNIFPSIETSVCAASVRKFNEIGKINNTAVLCISADLPFTQSRFFCDEKISNLVTLSTMRGNSFHRDYGVQIADGPLEGVTTRAVIVLDENNNVLHSERVSEITDEPNYDAAISSLK